MNKTRIQITAINTDNPLEIYMGKMLLLRTARKVGDIETVNNTVLGRLKEAKKNGQIDYITL